MGSESMHKRDTTKEMGQLSNLGVSNDEMEPKIEIYMKKINKIGHVLKVTLVGSETKYEISCIPIFIDPKSNFKKIKGVHSPRLYFIENISCAYSILIFVIAKRT